MLLVKRALTTKSLCLLLCIYLAGLQISVAIAQTHQPAAPNSHTKQRVELITFPIPLMVENESEGLFIELSRAIARVAGIDIYITVQSTPRAIRDFESGNYDVIMPGVAPMFSNARTYIASRELLYRKQDIVFTRRDDVLITSIDGLIGRRVGLTQSYPYAIELLTHPEIDTVFVTTDEQNAQLLALGRTDAFVVERSSGLEALRKTSTEHLLQYADQPISELPVFFAFPRTERGRLLESVFTNALRELKANGTFEQIFAPSRN